MTKKTIEASPRKSFFTDMLTRDITLQDCILDVIDNSVHWIIAASGQDVTEVFNSGKDKDVFSLYHVNVNFSTDSFSIEDNWSGIEPDYLEKYVFRFGSDKNDVSERDIKGLSVYGVGMKRSFFKIGRYVELTTSTENSKSDLNWDIEEWLQKDGNKDWDLEFDTIELKNNPLKWTKISIKNLNQEISDFFKQESFRTSLIKKVSLAYALFLECGLSININNIPIIADLPKLIDGDINYVYYKDVYKEEEEQIWAFTIIVWLTSASSADYYWWNIFCNGRMVLQWDKTIKTGWGWALRQFHSSINPFIGYIFLTSKNASFLPWNTTKDNVNFESDFYQYALQDMNKCAKPVVSFLASRYRQEDTIGEMEDEGKRLQNMKTKTVWEILQDTGHKNTIFNKSSKRKNTIKQFERISYQVELKRFNKIRDTLIKRTWKDEEEFDNSQVGLYTFEYFENKEC